MVSGKFFIRTVVITILLCIFSASIVIATDYTDPVSKTNGTVNNTTSFTSLNHTVYYFASPENKDAFDTDPDKYLNVSKNETAVDPVCKMEIDISTAKGNSTVDGKTYYFCSEMCKTEFNANPDKYLKGSVNNTDIDSGIDPVCGMSADPKTSVHSTYNGKTYYFCSDMCKTEFNANPDKYLTKNEEQGSST